MTEVGRGSRRVCLRLPEGGLCLKRYRDDDGVGASVRREIARCRFDRRRNTCAQEYDYLQSIRGRLSPETLAVFPDPFDLRFDEAGGWQLVEELVLNGDGSVPERFSRTFRAAPADLRPRLLAAFRNLMHAFEAAAVRFYDPQNVIVQWSGAPFEGEFRLRVVDFEPASRTLLPLDRLSPAFVRMKDRRRARRYLLQHTGVKYSPLPWRERAAWDEFIALEGGKIGLTDCCAFLENKLVNDIFYEGRFGGKPCIVKCSSRAPESIANEYELGRRLHEKDPSRFPSVYALHAGPRAFVVTEKIGGGRSLEGADAERFGDDLVAILDALFAANVCYRDILPSNFLVAPDGHLRLVDFQFAVDMTTRRVDPWLVRHPAYHFLVFAAAVGPKGAWWDDAAFVSLLFPFVRERVRPLVGRLRLDIPFSFSVRVRLALRLLAMRVRRAFTRKNSRRRRALDRRLERFA